MTPTEPELFLLNQHPAEMPHCGWQLYAKLNFQKVFDAAEKYFPLQKGKPEEVSLVIPISGPLSGFELMTTKEAEQYYENSPRKTMKELWAVLPVPGPGQVLNLNKVPIEIDRSMDDEIKIDTHEALSLRAA